MNLTWDAVDLTGGGSSWNKTKNNERRAVPIVGDRFRPAEGA